MRQANHSAAVPPSATSSVDDNELKRGATIRLFLTISRPAPNAPRTSPGEGGHVEEDLTERAECACRLRPKNNQKTQAQGDARSEALQKSKHTPHLIFMT